MKTAPQASAISPVILILALLAASIVFVGATGRKLPVLSNVRTDIVLFLILGMAICTQGGIGRVAATQQWAHPLSIVGYLLGALILLIALSVFAGWSLPLIPDDRTALVAMAMLAIANVVVAVVHSLLERG